METTQPLILRVCSTLRNVRVPCPRVYACVCPAVGEWEGGGSPVVSSAATEWTACVDCSCGHIVARMHRGVAIDLAAASGPPREIESHSKKV